MNHEVMASAARLAFEHGADAIKNCHTGSVESSRYVTESCPIPMMIAEGAQMTSTRAVFQTVKDAMTAGARGAVTGRNIWQHENFVGVTRALSRFIHEDISVDKALQELQEGVRV